MRNQAAGFARSRLGGLPLMGAIILLAPSLAVATKVRPVNLEEMTERAATVFSGRCVEVREEQDAVLGKTVTLVTFHVDRAVKGNPGRSVTVKMLGGRDEGTGVVGMPRFERGEQVILFLYGESSMGLSSPVGFGQGKFSVSEDKRGRPVAFNETGNRNLMKGLSPQARGRLEPSLGDWKEGDGLEPAALLDMVQQLKEEK